MQSSRPAFKSSLSVTILPGEGVFLVGENEALTLYGPMMERLAALVQGGFSIDEILSATSHEFPLSEMQQAISNLFAQGVLFTPQADQSVAESAFWAELGVDHAVVRRLLAGTPIEIRSFDSSLKAQLAASLASLGAETSDHGRLLVVIVRDYLDETLLETNQYCLSQALPWLAIKPSGVNIWAGPLLIPNQTACWECLRTRLLRNRQLEHHLVRKTGHFPQDISAAISRPSIDQAISIAALQTVRFIVTGQSSLLSSLKVVRTHFDETSTHAVQRLPQCASCGDPGIGVKSSDIVEFPPASRLENYTDGGERTTSPEQTYRMLEHLVSPLTGVVSEITPDAWNDYSPMYSYVAGHNFAMSSGLFQLSKHLRSNSGGKGKTDAQARTSALCEALERYSGRHLGGELKFRATLAELGDDGIHPNECLQYSDQQFKDRDAWNQQGSPFSYVPEPFDETRKIHWSPVYSVSHENVRFLPTASLYYGYEEDNQEVFGGANSNGAASGTTITDAALQGFYEVVERDAVALWWYNQLPRPGVELASLDDPYAIRMMEFCRQQQREISLLDLTTDLQIPVYAAICRRTDSAAQDIVFGFGAHMNGRIAALRAIAEMGQFLTAVLHKNADGQTIYQYEDALAHKFWREANTTNQPYLAPLPGVSAQLTDNRSPPDLRDQLFEGFDKIHNKGMEVLVHEQTRPDIGLPVVKVIIPGMRHFWPRFAPGRLYDVPVELGWQKNPTPELQLNPIGMFI